MASRSSNGTSMGSTSTDEVKKIFSKFDKNGDGKISCSELKDILHALGSMTSSEEVERIMSEIDKDGDGFISLDEFAEFHLGGSSSNDSQSYTRELRDAFDLYDLDKNGLISASELHAVLKRLGEKCTLVDCSKMISAVDVDGDAHVNFEEFKNMMSRG